MNHKNSKKVTIFRAGSFLIKAQGTDVAPFFATTKKSIGSYWESNTSKRIATGLTFGEEDMLLPKVLDVPAEDREFRKAVSKFYTDIDTEIPYKGGLELEIGLETDNDKPLGTKNLPLSISDYLRYRHAINHPFVAINKESADGNSLKEYYIFDKTEVSKKNVLRMSEKDAAIQLYLQLRADDDKVSRMLTVLAVDPRDFDGPNAAAHRQEKLRELSEKEPGKFVKEYNEADLEIRYWIKTMLNTNILRLVGSRVLTVEGSKVIGNTMEETIFFFKDDENSEQVTVLKAQMQDKLKSTR